MEQIIFYSYDSSYCKLWLCFSSCKQHLPTIIFMGFYKLPANMSQSVLLRGEHARCLVARSSITQSSALHLILGLSHFFLKQWLGWDYGLRWTRIGLTGALSGPHTAPPPVGQIALLHHVLLMGHNPVEHHNPHPLCDCYTHTHRFLLVCLCKIIFVICIIQIFSVAF